MTNDIEAPPAALWPTASTRTPFPRGPASTASPGWSPTRRLGAPASCQVLDPGELIERAVTHLTGSFAATPPPSGRSPPPRRSPWSPPGWGCAHGQLADAFTVLLLRAEDQAHHPPDSEGWQQCFTDGLPRASCAHCPRPRPRDPPRGPRHLQRPPDPDRPPHPPGLPGKHQVVPAFRWLNGRTLGVVRGGIIGRCGTKPAFPAWREPGACSSSCLQERSSSRRRLLAGPGAESAAALLAGHRDAATVTPSAADTG
ncbi:hypothetical protein LV779_36505 [Streptomyces thinghirensis]|nr:hypothetical protein [Streptomyces thinghirensis]